MQSIQLAAPGAVAKAQRMQLSLSVKLTISQDCCLSPCRVRMNKCWAPKKLLLKLKIATEWQGLLKSVAPDQHQHHAGSFFQYTICAGGDGAAGRGGLQLRWRHLAAGLQQGVPWLSRDEGW